MAQRLQGLGTNLLTIFPGSQRNFGVNTGSGSKPTLTEADAKAIRNDIGGLNGVSPVLGSSVQAVYSNTNWSTRAQGVYPDYFQIQNWQIEAGDAFNEADLQQARSVAVIGQVVLDNLFGDGSTDSGQPTAAIGQTIRLRNVPFQIVGVLASKSQDQDDVILVPFTTANRRLNSQTNVA